MKSICKMLRTVPVEDQTRMMMAFDELRPLFERFGIGAISDVLKAEVKMESDKNSMRMYKTSRNKLTGPGNLMLQYPPETIPGIDYSDLPRSLPLVSVIDGIVHVDGEVCLRSVISNMRNEIRWSREIKSWGGDVQFEHGTLTVDPLMLSAQGELFYSEDAEGQKLLPVGYVHYLAMGGELDGPPSYDQAFAEANPPAYAMYMVSEETEVTISVKAAMESMEEEKPMAEEEPEASPDTEDDAKEDPLFLPPDETMPLLDPLRFNMMYDANRYKKNQVIPGDAVPFGPLDVAVGRKHAEGLSTRVALLPNLDKLYDIITEKHVDSTLGKLASFYSSMLSLEADGRTKVSITMAPNAQELLKEYRDKPDGDGDDSDEEYSLEWTFKKSLGTDIKLGMLFATIEITLGPDGKTAMGTITEYSSDTDSGEGQR
jgi:hypothetical protein